MIFKTTPQDVTHDQLGWLLDAVKFSEKKEKEALKHGQTILHVCARNTDDEEIIMSHINAGYNVNSVDLFGQTPLFYAIGGGNLDVCKLLIDNGADVNHQDKNLNTPLIKATVTNNLAIMKVLIDSGADVNKLNKYQETALKIACQEHGIDTRAAKLLIDNLGEMYDDRNN